MEKIRWGFLGTAAIGASAYVPAIRQSSNGLLHGVASREGSKARAFAEKHGFVRSYGSYEALLADPEIDAVYNPLPNSLHAEWSIRAAEAGKAVLCEKPLAVTAAEGRRMGEVFRRHQLLLVEAFMYRHHPLNQRAVALVREGKIGRLMAARASFFGVEGKNVQDIRFSAELGGGALGDLGCYCVSLLRWVAGEEPAEVRGMVDPLPSGVDGRTAGVMKFPSGVVADFSCGFMMPFSCSYEFLGSTGRILVDQSGMIPPWEGLCQIKCWTQAGGYEEIGVPADNPYRILVEKFGRALLDKEAMEPTWEDSIGNLGVMDRILADGRVRGPV